MKTYTIIFSNGVTMSLEADGLKFIDNKIIFICDAVRIAYFFEGNIAGIVGDLGEE